MSQKKLLNLSVIVVVVFANTSYAYDYSDYVWYSYGGHQYAATFSFGPWIDAEAEAQALGWHLVAINDAAENQWLAETFDQVSDTTIYTLYATWIGYELVAGSWQWSNGEPTTFENICATCFRDPGPHMFLVTPSSPTDPPYTWNYNNWHDTRPSHYLHGIIEIVPTYTTFLNDNAGFDNATGGTVVIDFESFDPDENINGWTDGCATFVAVDAPLIAVIGSETVHAIGIQPSRKRKQPAVSDQWRDVSFAWRQRTRSGTEPAR